MWQNIVVHVLRWTGMYTPVGFETEAVQFQERTSRNEHVSNFEAEFQDNVVEGFHILDIF